MAVYQNNPGFIPGQVPTADQWNAAWTTKQDALISTITTLADYTVANTICKVIVDTSSADRTITVPVSFGTANNHNRVRIVKRSATPNTHQVIISDGTNPVAYLVNENDGSGGGWLDIDTNGSSVVSICGIP